jgi:hypothetical protein
MTIGSAASRPGLKPAAPLPSLCPLETPTRGRVERGMPEASEAETTILYPTAPQIVSWPRVFPQL